MKRFKLMIIAATALSLSGCGDTFPTRRSSDLGSSTRTANSLWQPGARGFFRDQRATRVGDILRVNVAIADSAKFDNTNNSGRTTSDKAGINALGGLEAKVGVLIPIPGISTNPANLLDINGATQANSTGKIDRKETINTQVAALVTQVLPNGNLVIEGTQEILVNYEVSVRGVIRPQDITSDNSVDSSQIAQARIVYSGRGRVSELAQPRWGSQAVEILSPF